MNRKKPVTAIIVGAGHRGILYASFALQNPEMLKIVGVVEPNELRRQKARDMFDISTRHCYSSIKELINSKKVADAAINGTMDKDHLNTSVPLLEAGYHLLLEKPITTNEDDLLKLLEVARKTKQKVMICHVLRYAPFYVEIKKRISSGEIGEILNIQSAEHVSYHHLSASYVRGKWNSKSKCHSSMLMAKCCHDLDILTWLKSGIPPLQVSSFGSLMYFRPDRAPKEAGTRCLVDCPIEAECLYSARKIYLDHPDRWSFYVWSFIEDFDNPTNGQMIESLKTDNPHGRCIWKCDNDVVDHQSVIIQFADGSTATHNMVGGTSRPCRTIHVLGTQGEILGILEDGSYTVRKPDPRSGHEYKDEVYSVNVTNDSHGGGDMRLVEDLIRVLSGEEPSISSTTLEDSIYGHLLGFRADKAMEEKRVFRITLP